MLDRRVDGCEQPRAQQARREPLVPEPGRHEGVDRAGLDEALEHALVHDAKIDSLAQLLQ